jgi:hypothetical protein
MLLLDAVRWSSLIFLKTKTTSLWASLKALTACQAKLVEVVLKYKKLQIGFDRLNLTRFLEMTLIFELR